MFRFLHAADIHLDSPLYKLDYYEGAPVDELRHATRRAFDNLVKIAIRENVSFVLIAGDLYDGDWKDYNTGLYFVSQTSKLRDAGIPVYMVAGNHDAASKISRTLRFPENVHLFPTHQPVTLRPGNIDVAIHGQGFASPAVKKDLSAAYPHPQPGCFNIGMLHTCATGREGHEPYAPCTLEGLRSKEYDYWALGHVHQHEVLMDEPLVVFPGNIQGRHVRETGPKGCVLVSVDNSGRPELEFKPLDVIRWVIIHVDASGDGSGYDVVDRFNQRLEAFLDENEGLPLVTRVVIEGDTQAHSELISDTERWTNEIRSAAVDIGGGQVWVEKVKFQTKSPLSDKSLKSPDGAIGELVHLFDELHAEPDRLHDLADALADLEKSVPRELKEGAEGMKFDDPEWLSALLDQVRPMLLQRLIRKEESE
ncbi:MAG: DNA repair exonuclease [Deltaproteobacteria bacterium]|nr:DNA repair exonuclease [Deltaproteobacteria bacterium]